MHTTKICTALAALMLISSAAFASIDSAKVSTSSTPKTTAITKGAGFDVLNKTDEKIVIVVNGHTVTKTYSDPGEYGNLPAPWFAIKLLCFGSNPDCPAVIHWGDKSINVNLNTETGVINHDKSLDANLPGLNEQLKPLGLMATLSNEINGKTGRDGYELVTVEPLKSADSSRTIH